MTLPPSHPNAPNETSAQAAARIAKHARSLRAKVLAFLVKRGKRGATDQEVQEALGLEAQTQVPRRWELVKSGMVGATDRRRPTRSGRGATVWVVRDSRGTA